MYHTYTIHLLPALGLGAKGYASANKLQMPEQWYKDFESGSHSLASATVTVFGGKGKSMNSSNLGMSYGVFWKCMC